MHLNFFLLWNVLHLDEKKNNKLDPLYKASAKIKWSEYFLNSVSNECIPSTPRRSDTHISSLIVFQASLSQPPADITHHTDIHLLIPPKDQRPCSKVAFFFSDSSFLMR